MRLSRTYLNRFLAPSLVKHSHEQLIQRLNQLGLPVGGVQRAGESIEQVVIARVVSFQKHPNADRLRLCQIEDGTGVKTVVCGASNFEAGDFVVFARVGAVLPDGLSIQPVTIRGQQSQGMICAKSELSAVPSTLSPEELKALGIWNLTQAGLAQQVANHVGSPYDLALHLHDTLLEIEITPNRGDCLSYLGIARELMAKQGLRPPKHKEMSALWYTQGVRTVKASQVSLSAKLTAPSTPVFLLQLWETPWDTTWKTPEEVARLLDRHDLSLIHPLVDLGNFIMLESGQPIHVYDLDKVDGTLQVRQARKGETGVTLKGEPLRATGQEVVIADGEKLLCVGGIIGMQAGAVDHTTRHFAIEAAHFEPERIRKTCQTLGVNTDSSYRFERGVDPTLPHRGLYRYASLLKTFYDLKEIPKTINLGKPPSVYCGVIVTTPEEILSRVPGPRPLQAKTILGQLGCAIKAQGNKWRVMPPAHRFDLKDPCDLSEEVARHYGYDRITVETQLRVNVAKASQGWVQAKQRRWERVADRLVSLGFLENVHVNFLSKAAWSAHLSPWVKPNAWVTVQNPIHQDRDALPPLVFPRLVDQFCKSVDQRILTSKIFEVGRAFTKDAKHGVAETTHLALLMSFSEEADVTHEVHPAVAARFPRPTWAVLEFKAILIAVLEELGMGSERIRFAPGKASESHLLHPAVHQSLWCDPLKLGFFAQLHPQYSVLSKRKGLQCLVAEIDLGAVAGIKTHIQPPVMPSVYPGIARDVSARLPQGLSYGKFLDLFRALRPQQCQRIQVIDTFTEGDGAQSVTVRMHYEDPEKTLSDEMVNKWQDKFRVSLQNKTQIHYK